MWRPIGMAMAAIALTGLTACSASSGPARHTSSAAVAHSATRVVPRLTQAQIWDRSVCSRLDANQVVKASATGVTGWKISAAKPRKEVGSELGAPTFDYCRIAARAQARAAADRSPSAVKGDNGSDVLFGVSATTWRAAEWNTYRSAALDGACRATTRAVS